MRAPAAPPRPDASRRALLGALAGAPAVLVAGCVVTPYGAYYRPVAAAGLRERRAWCQGAAGPVTGVQAALAEGLAFDARTSTGGGSLAGARLLLTITLPAGRRLALPDPLLVLREAGTARAPALDVQASAARWLPLQPGAWADPARLRPAAAALAGTPPHGRIAWRLAGPPGFTPARIVVEGLALETAQGTDSLAPVVLSRPASRARANGYRSEAEQAQVRALAQACRTQTPQHACDNIVEYGDTSQSQAGPAAQWKAGWAVWNRGRGEQLFGDVEVVPATAAAWRVAPGTAQLRDADSGERRPLAHDGLSLSFQDRLAAGAVVQPGPAETTVRLEAALPPGLGDFEVLPLALRLDDRQVDTPALRFEVRRFDGGVEPFNC